MTPPIAIDPIVSELLAQGAPVAIGVSGGKDSTATALATTAYLNQIGHSGPRVLVHSDLGRVEWKGSLPACQHLAQHLGLELIVVRRLAGDLMDRWLKRWSNNVARYTDLLCVKLILPWSTASMRFCTSEMKTAVICRELIRRFPGTTIVSTTGIRRDESSARSKAPISHAQSGLDSKTHATSGFDWHPILDWRLADVLALHSDTGYPLHEAYTKFGSSRVSCAFCILGSRADLAASATCAENQDIYREMVQLEARSTFSFQDRQWLGDVAPHLLDDQTRQDLAAAKQAAIRREEVEKLIPPHLLYTKGWPTVMPTPAEALLIAGIRRNVAEAVGLSINYTDQESVLGRYAELMALSPARAAT